MQRVTGTYGLAPDVLGTSNNHLGHGNGREKVEGRVGRGARLAVLLADGVDEVAKIAHVDATCVQDTGERGRVHRDQGGLANKLLDRGRDENVAQKAGGILDRLAFGGRGGILGRGSLECKQVGVELELETELLGTELGKCFPIYFSNL